MRAPVGDSLREGLLDLRSCHCHPYVLDGCDGYSIHRRLLGIAGIADIYLPGLAIDEESSCPHDDFVLSSAGVLQNTSPTPGHMDLPHFLF